VAVTLAFWSPTSAEETSDNANSGTSTPTLYASPLPSTVTNAQGQVLEKIPAPSVIKDFTNIVKKGTTLWGVRKVPAYRVVSAAESACVMAAIDKKDQELKDNNTAAATNFNLAITARNTCQKSALASTDNQKSNLDACLKTFRESSKNIQAETKKNHDNSWKTYRESLKACIQTIATSTTSMSASVGEIMIEDGSGIITEMESLVSVE